MNLNPNLTSTLSLLELVIGITTFVGLILASALAVDYFLDFMAWSRNGNIKRTAVIGLRSSITFALIHFLFMFYVIVAAITPPPIRPQNLAQSSLSAGLFELMVLTMAVTSAFNLWDRFHLRRRLAAIRRPRYGERR